MPSSPNQQEQIDIRILRLIGLEDVFDLDYGTYLSLLKEVVVKGRMAKTSIPTEEIELVTQEFKRVRSKKDKGRFKVKSKKISASKLTGGSVAAIAGNVKALKSSMGSSLVAVSKKTTGGGESDRDPLTEINESLDRIAGLLIQQLANLKATGEKERRAAENKRREARETRLEKGFAVVTKVAKKIVAPVKSILDKIINFFVTIFLGRAVIKLLDWFGDPANAKKVNAIFRFLGDQWPKLIAAYLLFGNSLGRFVTRLSVRLLRAIATFALRNPKLAAAAGGIALGGFLVDYLSKNNPFQAAERDRDADRTVTEFNQGGFVSGQSGIDKIPAMLTDGEFVMSRGAVQRFGLDTLLAMNAAGGGTNRPRVVSGVSFAQGGGPIGDSMGPSDPTGLTMMRLLGLGSRQGLQGTRGFGGRGLGGTLELGYHGTSQAAGRSIRQGGFLPGSRRNTFGTTNVFAAPTSNINTIPSAAQTFSQKGGSAGRGALERFMDTFRSSSDEVGDLIPLAMSQGSGPGTRLPFNAFGLSEMSTSADKASKGARLVQNAMTKYPNSAKAQQLLTTGLTSAKLGPLAKLGRGLGRFIPGLNIALGSTETAMRTAQGDTIGATLAAASMVPGPTGMAAAAGLIIHDINKSFGSHQRIRGRSGAKRATKPAMRFAGGPAPSSPNRSYAVPPPIQNKTNVRYVNTPSGSSGGGYGSPAVSTREIPAFSAVIADSRRRSKAAQLGIG